MQPLSDAHSVKAILQRGNNAGYWTLETLDTPPAAYIREITAARKSEYFSPTYQPPIPYRNLLRSHDAPEAVQPISPRDFDVAAATRANEEQPNMDLLPQQWPPVPRVSHQPDQCGHQDPGADGSDHGNQGQLGATREHLPSSPRSDGEQSLEPVPTVSHSLLGW
jgi:hypothetical protein